MKSVIVEDEKPAARRLQQLLKGRDANFEILAVLDSIEAAVAWFSQNQHVDVVFVDIQLADGKSFEIFKHVTIKAPIIFTTAYDEYALQAFSVNSIDYLLKPIDEEKLNRSLQKLDDLKGKPQLGQLEKLISSFSNSKKYKNRFLIKQPEKLLTVETSQVAYFMAMQKMVVLVTHENRTFPVDQTLEELEEMLDTAKFYRLNRQIIASLLAIGQISTIYSGKLKISLNPPLKEDVFVSREKASDFKNWLDS